MAGLDSEKKQVEARAEEKQLVAALSEEAGASEARVSKLAEELAAARGKSVLTLEVMHGNRARRLYSRQGFRAACTPCEHHCVLPCVSCLCSLAMLGCAYPPHCPGGTLMVKSLVDTGAHRAAGAAGSASVAPDAPARSLRPMGPMARD